MAAAEFPLLAILDTVQAVPRSRSTHPRASERAEFKMRESGVMRGQALTVLEMIKTNPGRTSKELGAIGPLDRYQVARRLSELESAKLVRRTDEDVESRWWAEDKVR